jgi:MFS family permease
MTHAHLVAASTYVLATLVGLIGGWLAAAIGRAPACRGDRWIGALFLLLSLYRFNAIRLDGTAGPEPWSMTILRIAEIVVAVGAITVLALHRRTRYSPWDGTERRNGPKDRRNSPKGMT